MYGTVLRGGGLATSISLLLSQWCARSARTCVLEQILQGRREDTPLKPHARFADWLLTTYVASTSTVYRRTNLRDGGDGKTLL
jgi:hypothetical protein